MTHADARHITFDELGDFLDGRLPAAETGAIQSHLANCPQCSGQRRRLQALLGEARDLPHAIEPPPELWRGIRGRIERREPVSFGIPRWRLAAAALILVAASSGVTALLIGRRPTVVVRQDGPSASAASLAVPVAARAVAANYEAALRELNETLAERRPQLDPVTVAKVEASLQAIDIAIGEARRALAADPANRDLLDLLASSYERKVELLQRANALLPST